MRDRFERLKKQGIDTSTDDNTTSDLRFLYQKIHQSLEDLLFENPTLVEKYRLLALSFKAKTTNPALKNLTEKLKGQFETLRELSVTYKSSIIPECIDILETYYAGMKEKKYSVKIDSPEPSKGLLRKSPDSSLSGCTSGSEEEKNVSKKICNEDLRCQETVLYNQPEPGGISTEEFYQQLDNRFYLNALVVKNSIFRRRLVDTSQQTEAIEQKSLKSKTVVAPPPLLKTPFN